MTESLAHNLIATAERHPERPALRLDDTTITYRELDDLTARLGALLIDRGLQPGDPVGVMLPNVPEFAVVYYAVLRAGGIVVPMNVLLKQREVAFYLGDSGARLIFAWHAFEDQARAGAAEVGTECIVVEPSAFAQLVATVEPLPGLAPRAAQDTAVILYTSGTTGKPKGAQLTHSNLAINADVSKELFSLAPDDAILGALPLFHAFGQTCALNAAVSSGASLTLIPVSTRAGRSQRSSAIGSRCSKECRRCTPRCFITPIAISSTRQRYARACPEARRSPSSCCRGSRRRSGA
jgi:long-chain acyl-CoA synthetase